MVRRYDEPVEVRTVQESGAGPIGAPSAFLWRGRLYAVRAVDGHWQERRAWWRDGPGGVPAGTGHAGAGESAPVGIARRPAGREIWRVRAQAGRAGDAGVFELGTEAADGTGSWRLLSAHD